MREPHCRQREHQGQKSRGVRMLGVFKGQQGSRCKSGRVNEGEIRSEITG